MTTLLSPGCETCLDIECPCEPCESFDGVEKDLLVTFDLTARETISTPGDNAANATCTDACDLLQGSHLLPCFKWQEAKIDELARAECLLSGYYCGIRLFTWCRLSGPTRVFDVIVERYWSTVPTGPGASVTYTAYNRARFGWAAAPIVDDEDCFFHRFPTGLEDTTNTNDNFGTWLTLPWICCGFTWDFTISSPVSKVSLSYP